MHGHWIKEVISIMMRHLIPSKLQQQRSLGSLPGAVKIIWTHIAVYVNAMTFILVMVTAYHTTVNPVTGLSFPIYAFVMGIIIIVVMVLEYKYIMPSSFKFHFDQSIIHSTVFKGWMERVDVKLESIEQGQGIKKKYHRRKYTHKVVV